jgi:hypothetical protein
LRIEFADPQHSLVLYGSPADMGAKDSWERLSVPDPSSNDLSVSETYQACVESLAKRAPQG